MLKKIALGVLAGLVVTSSWAAVVVTVETKDLSRKDAAAESGRIVIDGKKMVVSEGGEDPVPQMIFRGDRELIWAIDPQEREYFEIQKETVDQMGAQIDTAMKEMEKRLADMPPQQRAMVERMMRRQKSDAYRAAPPMGEPVVKRTEERDQIAGFPCRKYEIYRDDKKVREIWVTPWSNVDPGREAFGIFAELEDFFSGLLEGMKNSPMAGALQNPFDQASKIDGFPVLTREFAGGQATRESLFKSAKLQEMPVTAFEPPEGYEKTDPTKKMKKRRAP